MAIKHAATVTYPNGNIVSYHYDDEHPETPYSTLGDGEAPEAVHARIADVVSGKNKPTIPDLETLTALLASKHEEERRSSLAVAELEGRHADLTADHAELQQAHDELRDLHASLKAEVAAIQADTAAKAEVAIAPAEAKATP